jgi:hypothetical protein
MLMVQINSFTLAKKRTMKRHILFWLISLFTLSASMAQCKLETEMSPTGILIKTTEKYLLYDNLVKQVYTQVKHDGDDFFLILITQPIAKQKLEKGSAYIVLDGRDTLELNLSSQHYNSKDSAINALYALSNEQVLLLSKHPVERIFADIGLVEKQFILKLHKNLLRDQLLCILKEEQEGN